MRNTIDSLRLHKFRVFTGSNILTTAPQCSYPDQLVIITLF